MPIKFPNPFRRSPHQRAYQELAHLDDHLLNDMGLTRGDVNDLLRGRSRARKPGRDNV